MACSRIPCSAPLRTKCMSPVSTAPLPIRRRATARWMSAVLVVAVIALFALPVVLMLLGPLRPPGQPPPDGFELIPSNPGLQAFRDAFTLVPMGRALLNSMLVTAVAVPLTVLIASWGGLALTLLAGRLRLLLIGALLLLAMVPITAVWIPRFLLFDALGLIGTYVPLIAPALMGGSPLFVLLYHVAMRRIPMDVFDAARMEGAGLLRVWWRVALPLVKPTTTAIALLAVVMFWSNFIDPLLYLRSERDLTAPPMLHHLELLGSTNWSVFLAGALVVTVPVVVVFLVAQRFLWTDERGSGWLGR